jgi:hypothetical protein
VLAQQGGLANFKEEDARAAFLQHADKEDAFSRFTAAYEKTQGPTVFAAEEEDEEDAGE